MCDVYEDEGEVELPVLINEYKILDFMRKVPVVLSKRKMFHGRF